MLIYKCRTTPHFDFTMEIFYKGWSQKKSNAAAELKDGVTSFQEIAGLQMVREIFGFHNLNGKKVPIESYELNFVKNDGSRVHIIDDGSLELIYRAGNAIAQRLGIPFWDERKLIEPGEKLIPSSARQIRKIVIFLGLGMMFGEYISWETLFCFHFRNIKIYQLILKLPP